MCKNCAWISANCFWHLMWNGRSSDISNCVGWFIQAGNTLIKWCAFSSFECIKLYVKCIKTCFRSLISRERAQSKPMYGSRSCRSFNTSVYHFRASELHICCATPPKKTFMPLSSLCCECTLLKGSWEKICAPRFFSTNSCNLSSCGKERASKSSLMGFLTP